MSLARSHQYGLVDERHEAEIDSSVSKFSSKLISNSDQRLITFLKEILPLKIFILLTVSHNTTVRDPTIFVRVDNPDRSLGLILRLDVFFHSRDSDFPFEPSQ
jgi:hypothetical protein